MSKGISMLRARSVACGVITAVAFVSGGHFVALAQQRNAAAQDPTKITVTKRAYDKPQLLSAPALSDEAYRGRTIWLQRCAYCHDGVGQPSYNTMGSWLGAETVQVLTEPAIRAIVAAGTERMPGFSYALTSQQVGEVIAFLKTVPSSTKPTPAQLAGRAEGAAGSGD
jgi:mono/diheme cytochrome c family protein